MSRKMMTPVNQVRLTNVAVVRYRKKGKRFEIACYKNKVISWRNKIEKDIDEVLQSAIVFLNVSKGVQAKKEDLVKVFGTDDQLECCKVILEKGNLQVSEKERKQEQETKSKDMVTIIAQKCINSETNRPFPVHAIEQALKEIKFVMKPNKSAKAQALLAIPELKAVIPIQRAQMRLRLECDKRVGKEVKKTLEPKWSKLEEEEWSSTYEVVVQVDPGQYRVINDEFMRITKGKGALEILDMQVKDTQDEYL